MKYEKEKYFGRVRAYWAMVCPSPVMAGPNTPPVLVASLGYSTKVGLLDGDEILEYDSVRILTSAPSPFFSQTSPLVCDGPFTYGFGGNSHQLLKTSNSSPCSHRRLVVRNGVSQ
jgi:hypothetical protein